MPRGVKETIDTTKSYNSLYDGEYNIIKDLGFINNVHKCIIKFKETGNEQEAILYRAIHEQVRDRAKHTPIVGKLYKSNNYGDFIVTRLIGNIGKDHSYCEIKFVDTGTITNATYSAALSGNVADRFRATVCGVGYIGNASTVDNASVYHIWHDMIRRCYDSNCKEFKAYGGRGVIVCDRWKNFENFVNDIKLIPGYQEFLLYPGEYQLDKDKLQFGQENKIYSPETCCFIHRSYNAQLRSMESSMSNSTSKYIGVHVDPGRKSYRATITINGNKINLSSYDSEIAAATVYNNACLFYFGNGSRVPLNNVPFMSPEELVTHRTNKKYICNMV